MIGSLRRGLELAVVLGGQLGAMLQSANLSPAASHEAAGLPPATACVADGVKIDR